MTIQEYLENIDRRFNTGISREHAYRGDLQNLIESLAAGALATNEPARIECGAPDFIITVSDIPVGYIEAKDIGKDLTSKDFKEQFDRYRKSLNNLLITDYLDFRLYVDGEFVTSVKIAEINGGAIKFLPENYARFTTLVKDFSTRRGQTITNPKNLAEMMAGKAKMLAQIIEEALNSDEETSADSTLKDQMHAFLDVLIHDLTPKDFADIYAQTIAYGMFAARLHDPNLETFSRQEAAELIPKSNPFLRKLFQHIAGYDLDTRIKWIVDALAEIFRATDVKTLLVNFGKSTETRDPIIHFYETFLAEYDPKLRKSRGVYYTPEPVVDFIVRAVDDILKTEFNLPQGLADTSKTTITLDTQTRDSRTSSGYKQIEKEVHKVQILDPATGTGTFLAAVVKHIYKQFAGQEGIWTNYVENHLVPRLNGFELLMASYTIAHLKLDMLLTETNYHPSKEQRFRVYLTNALEEHHPDTGTLFATWLSREANEANYIKRDTPVMCVIGNPPYSGISQNKSVWISDLIDDYKYVDGEHFNERKHWLNDDYVKFLRFGEHFIERNGEGVLAFINNHSFLDNPTFRGMRWHILNSFDKIYIIDLHGNALKKEVSPDGSPDKNVFDIQAGVSINVFVKTGKKKKGALAQVKHFDLWGERENKYQALWENDLRSFDFKDIDYTKPYYFFKPKSEIGKSEYENGFRIDELFPNNKTGIVTMGDGFIVAETKAELKEHLKDFFENEYTEEQFKNKYGLGKNYAEWLISNKKSIKVEDEDYVKIDYRPFDTKWTIFDNKLIWRWRLETMQHFLNGENVGLVIPKINKEDNCFFITKHIMAHKLCSAYDSNSAFPLYLYPEISTQQTFHQTDARTPNLNREIVDEIAARTGLTFTGEKEETEDTFAPIDILDYIYAVLHSPAYREKYKEFLKIDFPRVPYPKDAATFWQMAKPGGELRQIHLLESPIVERFITTYPRGGDNRVTRKMTTASIGFELTDLEAQTGRVWINDEQFFDGVPHHAWNFYIGGYQPAQKWLKDRHNRELSFEDIRHYQKIIVALTETDRIMREIDRIEFE